MKPRRPDLDSLDREIRDHIDAETEENIARGMTREDAYYAALRKFGNPVKVKEDVRAVWLPNALDQLLQDGRDGVRLVRRNPGFSLTVVLTLALGIGLTTAVYAVINTVLVRPLSFPDVDRLVWLTTYDPVGKHELLTAIDFADWKAQAFSLEQAAAYTFTDATFQSGGEAARARVVSATDGFWEITGAKLALGRFPRQDDQRPLLLSHLFFTNRMGGDVHVIGKAVMLDGMAATVVGVLAPDFRAHMPVPMWRPGLLRVEPDMFRPLVLQPNPDRRAGQLTVNAIGKLKPGATLAATLAELETIRNNAQSAVTTPWTGGMPAPWQMLQPRVALLQETLVGGSRVALSLLMGAALILLAITCANVANLLLARSTARHREIALRMSVGGGPLRILRQLMCESLVFSAIGGALGVTFAHVLLMVVIRTMPNAVPRLAETAIDIRVLAFALLTSILTAFLFGLAPSVALCRTNLQHMLTSGAQTQSRGGLMAGRLMIAAQLALTLLLLSGAGLMLKSVWLMNQHSPGFEPAQILTMRVDFRGPQYRQPESRHAYARAILSKLSAVPGIQDVAITTGNDSVMLVVEEGTRPDPAGSRASISATSARFAPMLGMRLVRGRWFEEEEPEGAVLINETLARTQFGGRDPIGVRVRMPAAGPPRYGPIVGVVGDMKFAQMDAEPGRQMFVHYAQTMLFGVTIAARTAGDPLAVAPDVRKVVASVDPTQSIFDVQTLSQSLNSEIAQRRFNTILLVSFAVVALLLATIGLYGVVAYAVAERTNEIGIRMALGAARLRVVGMIVRDGMFSITGGVIVGLIGAIAFARLMTDLLYGVDVRDVPTLATATALLAAIAFIGCVVPALKAAVVDPVVALRNE
ncbi:MAG TPA: ABC transporter permease [Vicinamibacterales bacterium]|nr:ABC transporter permease [Vicinamibacterales bacterium]